MKLSRRLSMIASMVRRCHSVADIGSDHAYIPCALVLNNQCAFAIAADIAKGPLEQAINNIEKYELNDKVIPVLSDGLINVEPTDCIVIAGMGVITAIEIMEAQLDKIKMAKQVVVQVNKDPMTLRPLMMKHAFMKIMTTLPFHLMPIVAVLIRLNNAIWDRFFNRKMMIMCVYIITTYLK